MISIWLVVVNNSIKYGQVALIFLLLSINEEVYRLLYNSASPAKGEYRRQLLAPHVATPRPLFGGNTKSAD